jgi:hypothetical protein
MKAGLYCFTGGSIPQVLDQLHPLKKDAKPV